MILPRDVEVRKRRLELTIWAFLLSLAFYPDWPGFLAWFSLVRPIMIISRMPGRAAFSSAYLFAFCFNAFSLYWVAQVSPPGVFSAVAIVSLYFAAIFSIFNKLYRFKPIYGIVALPFLWVGLEYFRTLSEFAFPWSDLGYTQSYYLYILQVVSLIGVHGLSFLILVVNILLWQILRREVDIARRVTAGWVSLGIVVLLIACGWAVTPPIQIPGKYPVAILQGSVPVNVKWAEDNEEYSFKLYDSLARSLGERVNLVVWPETAAPSYVSHDEARRSQLANLAADMSTCHLVGALGAMRLGENWRHFNSAYFFDSTGRQGGRYDKVKLVPFTEQSPYQDQLPFLRKEFITRYLSFIETYDVPFWSDFYPGDSAMLFEASGSLFGPLICYEVTFPEYVRKLILDGADFIVEITNDTWFGHSVGIHMHSRVFVTRAVENRCWGVRAANSGLSYVVDAHGRIREQLPLDAVSPLTAKISLLDGFSLFTRTGDVAGKLSFLITLVLAVILPLAWVLKKVRASRAT
ncbi:MAG: apolipoprotein N-acyltransferase [Candidatus Zixiibacteriota bacterium]